MDEPRRIPIHRSINRPNMIMGGERELVLMSMFVAALICFTASTWMQVVLGVVFWLVVHSLVMAIAKADPFMSAIYLRHVRYASYYSARATDDAPSPFVHARRD